MCWLSFRITFASNSGKATANISVILVRSSSCTFFSFAVRTLMNTAHRKATSMLWNHSRATLPLCWPHIGVLSSLNRFQKRRALHSSVWGVKIRLLHTLFPLPLPTGGWHSQACRMAHSMISTRAVSCRSVRAKKQNKKEHRRSRSPSISPNGNINEGSLTFLSLYGLIQQYTDHRFPVLQQFGCTVPQTIH